MDVITEEERFALVELRKRITDIELDEVESHDLSLICWVRARNCDVERAERMIRRSMEWRKETDFDNIISWEPPANYDIKFAYQVSGFTDSGYPVVIVPVCEWDVYVKKELAEGRKELVQRYVIQMAAKLLDSVKVKAVPKENRVVTQFIIIFDLEGFNIRHLTSVSVPEVLLESFRQFERNFPETLGSAIVLNAPSLFTLLFPIVKKMLAAKTISKVQLYDGNSNKWKKVLLRIIPKSQLPVRYGGEIPDTLKKKIEAAKLVCNETGLGMSGISLDSLTKVNVGAGSKYILDYDIKDPNVKISWIFKTHVHDIGFAITFKKKQVVSRKRINSQDIVQEGSFLCPEVGKYTITFDNTYSLFRAKVLYYLITVENGGNPISPNEE